MPQPTGRTLPLSLPRRFIGDLVHFAQRVPSVPVERRMRLADLVAARHQLDLRPSWCAIFTKAYGLVAHARPELRRAYLGFPWARLYEHPINVASVAVERRLGDEDAVVFGHLTSPEQKSLEEIDRKLRALKEDPVGELAAVRRILRISRLPRPLRRSLWWIGLNVWGRKRAHFLGTYGVTVYAGLGASSLHPLSPLTTTLNYGVISPRGTVDVRLCYDHRVLDGAQVARALGHLEEVLRCELLAELRVLRSNAA